ncbi:hypothetical protein BCR41DRAFT_353539 [Lobosporangium transversale]|uniref:Uncharacterized protein n=1 Tax=Lobosporangium transversale TaxID=64571 RepID=A0A1Y2GQB5_9FUNG|nr:hypothetical protein BCR41DRAFT_353539 [Lobosporangium transversale]ORZ16114.1 hypothetical protein BCR41DRAFT_353539 [Lobosporangium transversale]|eukprot:XP_021881461.1 hypothetical protein BCR41DRAFT_353539 [Lobosporangium transversale]
MRFSSSSSLLGATALAALAISSAQVQDTPVAPPHNTDYVDIVYLNDGNGPIGTEHVPFNTCFASELAFSKYSFLNFAPNNATINFYTDSNCQNFTFGLDGYYGGYPGAARSFKWVGWSTDSLGEIFNKAPIQGQGDAATGGNGGTQAPPGGVNPNGGTPPPAPAPNTGNKDQTGDNNGTNNADDSTSGSSSSTFFGGVVGSVIVLSAGGIIFWKTAGKKLVEDKGKGVLPYNRVGRDGDILLTSNNRGHGSFEIGDEDDDDEVDSRPQRSGRQERYRDDDHA